MKTISGFILLAFAFIVITSSAAADTLKLNSGQVHKGTITAEEDDRIQIKLESSGVRLWFPRDQVLSFDKTERKEDGEAEEEDENGNSESGASQLGLEDDVERARQMLEELRQQQLNEPKKTRRRSRTTITKPPTKKGKKQKGPITLTDKQVDAQINILRNSHDIYKRLDAIKKLGRGGVRESIPDLIHALDDETQLITSEASKSLIKITGQDFKFNSSHGRTLRLEAIERWKKWYKEIKDAGAKEDLKSWF